MKAVTRVLSSVAKGRGQSYGAGTASSSRNSRVTYMPAPTLLMRNHASLAWIGYSSLPSFATEGKPTSFLDVALYHVSTNPGNEVSFPREIIWLGGAPGAGKGTNAATIAAARNIAAPTVVMSSLLDSPECQAIKAEGGMVDDAFVLGMLLKELCKPQYRAGVIVDGFPRTKTQVDYVSQLNEKLEACGRMVKNIFVMLHVSEEVSIQRQLLRGQNVKTMNSLRAAANLPLLEERRTDLSEHFARYRYQLFSEQMSSLMTVSEQHPCVVVNAEGSLDIVKHRINKMLTGKNPLLMAGVYPVLRFASPYSKVVPL